MSKATTTKIEKEKWYKLTEIVALGLIPWCKDIKTIRKWVLKDKSQDNLLKINVVGRGKKTRYHILGDNLNQYIAAMTATKPWLNK